ncbi:MAG: imidazole glycerol phosphate synthase subunit HisH [Flavobacterium sp.]|nr:imidazole glycerol phosphate synthase subunit HisH [Candidatus Neoflavobacterium equi]
MKIAIIDYGAGNVQSVLFAIERLGYSAVVTADKEEIITADYVIFPGVGEASFAMRKLESLGLVSVIKNLKQPVLGICLGMQLLCAFSEEGDTAGIGIFDLKVQKFSEDLKVPQVGWNTITDLKNELFEGIAANAFMYLVHSYYVPMNAHAISTTSYGVDYATAIQKDNFYGVQFHPEKSGAVGSQIIKAFLNIKTTNA